MPIKMLILSLIIATLSGCSFVNQIRMRFSNDDLKAEWIEQKDSISLQTRYISNKPHVYIDINGEQGFLFLIDSGASITYLMDSPKVAALDLDRGFDLRASGWGDEDDSKAYQVTAKHLNLSGVGFANVSMAYLPVSTSLYYARPDEVIIDGVLGHDILKHFVWRFNPKQNRIEISLSPYQPKAKDISVDFEDFMSKLSIPVQIDLGSERVIEHDVLIDTGSRHFFKLNQAYLDEESIILNLPSVTGADFGLSGRAIHQRVTLPSIKIGELSLKNIKTNLIKTEDPDDLWVIGSAALNQYISVLDYKQNKLFLTPYKNTPFMSRYNLLGLELRKISSGEFVVRYIMPDLVTANLDFKVGDLITTINGIQSKEITEDKWLHISNQPGEYTICRTRQPDQLQQCLLAISRHVSGYSNHPI